jgi:hypothetical protein
MWMRMALAAVLVVVLGTPADAAQQNVRVVAERYTTAAAGPLDCDTGTGGVCLELAGDETAVGLFVRDDDGWTRLPAAYRFLDPAGAELSTGTFCERTQAAVPRGAAALQVAVALVDPTGCGHPSLSRGGEVRATFDLSRGHGTPALDGERACPAGIGEPVSYALPPDDGRTVDVRALVLLDGVAEQAARTIVEQVSSAFNRVGIHLTAAYQPVALAAQPQVDPLFTEIKATVGGAVPTGFDLVHTLTTKDLVGISGYADCVGGVLSRSRAFSASEVRTSKVYLVGSVEAPVWPYTPYSKGILATHEIGHLFGGNHDYANCAEGAAAAGYDAAPGPCTVMYTPISASSLGFSALNRVEVRGHARELAELRAPS